MSPSWPLVSVITPVYNGGEFLAETIDSVLGQDYPRLEYLVLDDGSTDSTAAVLSRYANVLRVERHENIGESRTVNKGFDLVEGDIIGVVSADDPLLPGAVRAAAARLMTDTKLVAVYPDWLMIDESGTTVESVSTHEYSYLNMVRWHHCMPGPGAFFRRQLLDVVGGRDPEVRYVGDMDFWIRAGLVGPFARLPETRATWRTHRSSTSISEKGLERAREHVRIIEKLYARTDLPPEIRAVRKEALSSAFYVAGWVCGSGRRAIWSKLSFWARAIALAPRLYATEHRARLAMIGEAGTARLRRALMKPVRAVARHPR